eukprot:GEMP01020003.1.p1 GENE.GEMP01020003.1~~GEMP01020003.1.p1  ORF type:complete len:531 (+),score=115.87 GEMP01020003.1:28-1620(+)
MPSHSPRSRLNSIHRSGVSTYPSLQALREEVLKLIMLPHKVLNLAVHSDSTALSNNVSRPDAGIRDRACLVRDYIAEQIEVTLRTVARGDNCSMSLLELAVLFSLHVGFTINQVLQATGAPPFKEYLKSRKEFDVVHGRCILVKCADGDACLKAATPSASTNCNSAHDDYCSQSTPRTASTSCATSPTRPADVMDNDDLPARASESVEASNAFVQERRVLDNDKLPSSATKGRTRALTMRNGSSGAVGHAGQVSPMISHRRTLNKVIEAVAAKLLADTTLPISQIRRSGPIEKGTEAESDGDAQIVVFIKDLPFDRHEEWLPSFLAKVHSTLCDGFKNPHLCVYEKLEIMKNGIRASVRSSVFLDIVFSPLITVHNAIAAMRNVDPEQFAYYEPALLCPRLEFFLKLSSVAKKTIIFLKSWRDQQNWISSWYRPSDALLEMLVAFLAIKTDCSEKQGIAVRQAFQILERFAELKITVLEYFHVDDIPKQFRNVRPLILDVANPYVNLADPTLFNSSQIISLAQQTHFTKR